MFVCLFVCFNCRQWIREREYFQELFFREDTVAEIPVEFLRGASLNGISISCFGLHGRLHCGEVLRMYFGLDLHRSRDALATDTILQGGACFFTGEAIVMHVAEAWVARGRLRVIGGVCHCWWLEYGRGA